MVPISLGSLPVEIAQYRLRFSLISRFTFRMNSIASLICVGLGRSINILTAGSERRTKISWTSCSDSCLSKSRPVASVGKDEIFKFISPDQIRVQSWLKDPDPPYFCRRETWAGLFFYMEGVPGPDPHLPA